MLRPIFARFQPFAWASVALCLGFAGQLSAQDKPEKKPAAPAETKPMAPVPAVLPRLIVGAGYKLVAPASWRRARPICVVRRSWRRSTRSPT